MCLMPISVTWGHGKLGCPPSQMLDRRQLFFALGAFQIEAHDATPNEKIVYRGPMNPSKTEV